MELFHEAAEENSYIVDDLRAEVSLLDTSLADRFSQGRLPFRVDPLSERSGPASYDGRAMKETTARVDTNFAHLNRNELDETRSNEAHLLHATQFQDPCNTQGPCPSKPFEGLEQCLPWHQRAWDNLSRGCSCHRRRCVSFQFEERPQHQVVDGYASHREYPILKPPHTTNQALTRVRDRVQDRAHCESVDPNQEDYGHTEWLTYMRDIVFPTSLWRLARSGMARIECAPGVPPYSAGMDMRSGGTTSNTDRISGTVHGVMDTRRTEYDTRRRYHSGVPSTYLASRPLLGRDGQDSEGAEENRQRSVLRVNNADPTVCGTSDHEDSRRLATGLTATYLVLLELEPKDQFQGQIVLLLEDRQIQVIEEQATGEAQRWEAIPLPHRRGEPCVGHRQ